MFDRLGAMEAFVRVFEARSFSKAAVSLQTTQPTLSRMIAQLERQLGVRLLFRSTRGLTPTEAGAAYYESARRTLNAAAEAENAARGVADGLSGRLRVGAAVTFAKLHIIPQLPRFLALHPGITVDLLMDDQNADLVAEGIDVAFRMGDLASSALTARRIGQAERRVYATTSYFKSSGDPVHPDDLRQHDAVTYISGGGGHAWTFRRGEEAVSITTNGRVNVTAGEGVREAVLAGLGFAIMSEWAFIDVVQNGTVRPVLMDWTLPALDLWAVYAAPRLTEKARSLVEIIEATASAPRLR